VTCQTSHSTHKRKHLHYRTKILRVNLLIIPPPPNHRPCRIPRPVDLVLVLLQADQPPAAPAHGQPRDQHADDQPHDAALVGEVPETLTVAAAAQDQADAAAGTEHEQGSEGDVAAPRALAGVAAEDREEPEDLDGEEREGEDLAGAGQAAGQDGGGHQGGVGAEAGGDVLVSGVEGRGGRGGAVVEEEDVDGEEQEGHCPDAVAGRGPGEGLEDWGEA
jgi:hypothetical protein